MSPRDVPHRIRLLGESDVRGLFDTPMALELARSMLRTQATDGSRLSTPSASFLDATELGGPMFKFKAATVGAMRVSGIRLIARRGGNTGYDASNFTAVYDHVVGALTGLVSEIWLSRLRTAAFGVASVEPLVRPGPLRIGVFGSGDVAAELVPLLALALPIAEIRVNSRRAERAEAFVTAMRERVDAELPIRVEMERRAIVAGADLVFTATEADEALVQPGWLDEGAVLCSMGSHHEVAFEVLGEVDRLVVDDLDYASVLGDAAAWIEQGRITREALAARVDAWASEVVMGSKPGRLHESDRILALIQGVATGDVAFAMRALRAAEAAGIGAVVDLR
jgi:ornithine cyclodeaminase